VSRDIFKSFFQQNDTIEALKKLYFSVKLKISRHMGGGGGGVI